MNENDNLEHDFFAAVTAGDHSAAGGVEMAAAGASWRNAEMEKAQIKHAVTEQLMELFGERMKKINIGRSNGRIYEVEFQPYQKSDPVLPVAIAAKIGWMDKLQLSLAYRLAAYNCATFVQYGIDGITCRNVRRAARLACRVMKKHLSAKEYYFYKLVFDEAYLYPEKHINGLATWTAKNGAHIGER